MTIYIYPPQAAVTITPPAGGFATQTTLALIASYVDGVETLVAATNTKLDTMHADNVVIEGYIDGIETLIGSTNTKLDSVIAGLKSEYTKANTAVLHNFATTGVTAGNYTTLIAITAAKAVRWQFANTTGNWLQLAYGAAGAEVIFCMIPPGGAAEVDISLALGIRLSVTSDENVSTGKLSICSFV